MHIRRLSVLPAILLGLVLLAAGCGKEKEKPAIEPEPQPAKAKDKEKPPPPETPKADEPAFTVSAIAITEECLKDAAGTEKKYKDKFIAVEGTVSLATQNSVRKTGSITLVGHRPPPDPKTGVSLPLQVRCAVKPEKAGTVGLLGKGQRVRVKGRFGSVSGGDVTLEKCDYEELTSAITPRRTAEEITKEFLADKEAASKKYLEKEVILSGTISDLSANSGLFKVVLEGTDMARVECNFDHEDEFKTLKKGDKIRIKGEAYLFLGKRLIVNSAFLVQK
jgi:hypothetical protein